MNKVLYVKANAKPEGTSRTFKVSDSFVKSYKELHPDDEIIILDLYKEDLRYLQEEDIVKHWGLIQDKNHPVFKYAHQFMEMDKIIIAAPFWNLSFPAILKTYLDSVVVGGITFKYTTGGTRGLCHDKKVIHFVTRGGEYSSDDPSSSAYELGDKYLRTIFAFIGITDYQTFALENMDRSSTNVELVIEEAKKETHELAKEF